MDLARRALGAADLAPRGLAARKLGRGGTRTSLVQILLFFTKAGAFVFGSGLAIVPFLQQGVVQQFGWLNEQQFLDAVAVAMITPGPVVITVAFIGYLVAGLAGATWPPSAFSCRSTSSRSFRRHGSSATATTRSSKRSSTARRRRRPVPSPGRSSCLGARAIIDLPTALSR